jgi:hypothetical protein
LTNINEASGRPCNEMVEPIAKERFHAANLAASRSESSTLGAEERH